MTEPKLQDLRLTYSNKGYAVLEIARPHKLNSFTDSTLQELSMAMNWLDQHSDVRAVIVRGQGENFSAGIDLESFSGLAKLMDMSDPTRAAFAIRQRILKMQEPFDAIERCRWPVIAAIQGVCIGGGVDLIAACDIRYCSEDSTFSIKEVDLAIPADLGSLQRLPPLVGHGVAAELALTARTFSAAEAKAVGLVSEVLPDGPSVSRRAEAVAEELAKKSPLAVVGTKRVLLHSRDSDTARGLEYVATWNGGQLLSHDLKEVMAARRERRPPVFSKL